jgi:hypothetical protein
MKRTLSLFLAALALGLAPLTLAHDGPQPQMQPAPQSEPPAAPAADPSAAAGPPSAGAAVNTRVAALVPSGMSADDACKGFRDLGECSAALHLSQNLNIPFSEVKGRVTNGQSLGAAVHALKPTADAKREVRRAEEQAREDLLSQG